MENFTKLLKQMKIIDLRNTMFEIKNTIDKIDKSKCRRRKDY
jgi:hypothetical protein